jgi:flavin reductase (DIM6/NTAB) family NADH-FMN oxidoreductase RutF
VPKARQQDIRAAFGAFATGVTVVTARSGDGRPVAMTVSSFAGVSLDPPLVLWCAQRDVWPFEVFNAAQYFAVHVLHAGQADLALHFAREIDDKFAGIDHRSGIEELPILDDYAALFQCRVEERLDGGDHLIVLGRVIELDHRPNDALVFHAGQLGGFEP